MKTVSEFVRVRMTTLPLPNPLDPGPKPESYEDLVTLGKEAEKLLHYGELKRKVDLPHNAWEQKRWSMNYYWERICKKVQAENHLAEVFTELEIDIVDHESVSRYRDGLLQELTKPKHTGRLAWFLNIFETSPEFRWRRVILGDCASVPPFVLNKAVQIKKRLPKAKFYVEQLVEVRVWWEHNCLTGGDDRREYYIAKSCSFLVVDYDGELYQSEKRHWNEEFSNQTYEHVERYVDVWEQ
jgi:hypothetical protein